MREGEGVDEEPGGEAVQVWVEHKSQGRRQVVEGPQKRDDEAEDQPRERPSWEGEPHGAGEGLDEVQHVDAVVFADEVGFPTRLVAGLPQGLLSEESRPRRVTAEDLTPTGGCETRW